jgi:hypothetical protein
MEPMGLVKIAFMIHISSMSLSEPTTTALFETWWKLI